MSEVIGEGGEKECFGFVGRVFGGNENTLDLNR